MKKILMTLLMASTILLVHAQDNTKNETTNDLNLLDLVQDQPTQSMPPAPNDQKKKSASSWFWDGRRHSLELTIGDPIIPMMIYHLEREKDYINMTPEQVNEEDQRNKNYRMDSYLWLPTFNLQYHYAFNHWFEFGALVGTTANGQYRTNIPDNTRTLEGEYWLYIMPSLRFTYFRRELINLYAGLAVGIEMDFYKSQSINRSSDKIDVGFIPAGQITAFGMQVGRRVYWTMEVGAGTKGIFNTGIGVKL